MLRRAHGLAAGLLALTMIMISACSDDDALGPIQAPAGMVVSYNVRNIATIDDGVTTQLTFTENTDWKPVSSPDGEYLVFIRVLQYEQLFADWLTVICVMNYDGTGLRELTAGEHGDFNPTFMRDGSNKIIFNRQKDFGLINEIYSTTIDASPGDEVMISHPTDPAYEWAYTSLKDGRLFVHRFKWAQEDPTVYLFTPNPGGVGEYELFTMSTPQLFHKASISPDETKITYLYDNDGNGFTYKDSQLAWARFDAEGLRAYDQELVTELDMDTEERYPKWNADGSLILYTSTKENIEVDSRTISQIYAYRLADGADENITPEDGKGSKNYQDLCVRGLPR